MLPSLYGAGMRLRNWAFERGIIASRACGVPVVSVGNITVGGAGKTPLVARLAERFLADGYRTAVVTRGYGRRTRGQVLVSDGNGTVVSWEAGGDEPVMLARALPGLIVIADERRARGCETAVRVFGAQRIVLDDAFQHRSCARNADVVAVDAMRDLAAERLLPSGRLREPLSALRRASAVILTRCESASSPDTVARQLRALTDAPLFRSRYEPRLLRMLATGETADLRTLQGKEVLAFCGIASPAAFRRTAELLGARVARLEAFRDHHPFTANELARVREAAAGLPLLTTEKDAVRLATLRGAFDGCAVYYPVMRAELDEDDRFFAQIETLLAPSPEPS